MIITPGISLPSITLSSAIAVPVPVLTVNYATSEFGTDTITPFIPVSASSSLENLTYSISPTLPETASFDTTTGEISGSFSSVGTTSYTITVTDGLNQSASETISITVVSTIGEVTYTASTNWVVPTGVTSISFFAVGGGVDGPLPTTNYGGGGGGSIYVNNLSVTPGDTIPITISGYAYKSTGASVTLSYKGRIVSAYGASGRSGGSYYNSSGTAYVGTGGSAPAAAWSGSGGAAGYAGPGGAGGSYNGNGGAGTNGGGGGGYGKGDYSYSSGGGVGLLGMGDIGLGGTATSTSGKPGSGGTGTSYGGGGSNATPAGVAAIRIIWPGDKRQFPTSYTSTLTYAEFTATTVISSKTISQSTAITPFIPVTASGGVGTPVYSISPSLPSGFSFDTSTGAISGTQQSTSASPSTTYTVSIVDPYDGAVRSSTFTMEVKITGQAEYTTGATYSWVCPAGVTSVSVVCIGGGASGKTSTLGGGGGGGLGYKNNIPVTPGQSYTVVVGTYAQDGTANGFDSYFISSTTVKGIGGQGNLGGSYIGDGGGRGGAGGIGVTNKGGGGGGAGGYSGTGGWGGAGGSTWSTSPPVNGSGGGGAGGYGASNTGDAYQGGGAGGGTGIYGEGTNGAKGTVARQGGGSGSGGPVVGTNGATSTISNGANGGTGGAFGGGGGGKGTSTSVGGTGSRGAVRIIWPGDIRTFPSTGTANL